MLYNPQPILSQDIPDRSLVRKLRRRGHFDSNFNELELLVSEQVQFQNSEWGRIFCLTLIKYRFKLEV